MIVTAWSPPDGSLLAGLLASLAALDSPTRPPVCVLVPDEDAAATVRRLAGAMPVETITADFATDGPSPHDALLPHLPHLTGARGDVIVFLSPTTWVQDPGAVAVLREAADGGAIAGSYPVDRAYRALASEQSPWHVDRSTVARVFGREAARRSWMRAPLDVGVFALAADAPHWRLWANVHRQAVARGRDTGPGPATLAAATLNAAIRAHRLPVAPLPARWNWLCRLEAPMWDGRRLTEPEPPYDPIAILQVPGGHAATLRDRAGAAFRSNLRFPLRVAPAVPA